jgi:hypothetical protein
VGADERPAVRIIRLAGAFALLLFVVGWVVGLTRPVTANPPGFATPAVGIELATTPAEIFGVLGAPGAAGRSAAVQEMRRSLAIDNGFLMAYAALYAGIALLLRARRHFGPLMTTAVLVLCVVMAIGDMFENRQLWILSGLTDPGAMAPVLGRLHVCTLVKWYAIFLASALVASGVAREASGWSTVPFALGALLGAVGLVHPPAIEWSMLPIGIAWAATWGHALLA